jgi:Tfp pilus assembly protein PilX
MHKPSLATARSRRQQGSAYMMALLALVILTVLGLSLSTTTSLELEIGTAERAITRTFYGSDSGLQQALARALTKRDYLPQSINLFSESRTQPLGTLSRGFDVDVSHMVPINVDVCNLCCVNENEEGCNFARVNHAVTSTATELTWSGSGTTPGGDAQTQAQKTLTIMFEVEPFWKPPTTSIDMTAEEAAKVKF